MDAEAKEIDDSTNAVASYTANGTVKYYDDLKSAIDAANADSADGKTRGVVKLLQDYKQSVVRDATLSGEDARNESEYKTSLVMEGTYTLDLNGKSINCESIGGGGWNGLSVLFVKSGKISLINSDSDHPGQINPNQFKRGIQICGDAHLEIGGSQANHALKSYKIQIYGGQYAVRFFDEGQNDPVTNKYKLNATKDAILSFVGGTNTLSSGQNWFNSAIGLIRGTCELLGGTNTFTTNNGTRTEGNTISISEGGTLRIAGGNNSFNGVYDQTNGGNAYTIGLVWSDQDDVHGFGNLEIAGGTTVLNGGKGNRLLGILPEHAKHGEDMVVSLVDALGISMYFQTSEVGEIQKETVDDIKDLPYATLARGVEIQFDGNGGQTADGQTSYTQRFLLNQETELKDNGFTREHYAFAGWYDNAECTGTPVTSITSDTPDGQKFYAKWEDNTCKVIFESIGGSSVSQQTVDKGECASIPQNPEREGYTFLEWQKNGKTFDFGSAITEDTTLTAIWMKKLDGTDDGGVKTNKIEEVPTSIQNAHPERDLSTPDKLNTYMLEETKRLFSTMAVTVEEIEKKQTFETYDVKLTITVTNSDGTSDKVTVTEENYKKLIPADGIDVLLPYPAAIDRSNGTDYTYAGVHILEYAFGTYQAGDTEPLKPIPTDKGLLVHLSGLSPILVTWQQKMQEEVQIQTKEQPSYVHECSEADYWWDVTEGTETKDGYMEYKCRECGALKYRVPISAYYTFNRNVSERIRNAKAGDTVEVATPIFVSFHEMVKDALGANPDVTVKVNYRYQGKFYDMVIPAGRTKTQLELLWNGTKFCGFRNMASQFVTTEN